MSFPSQVVLCRDGLSLFNIWLLREKFSIGGAPVSRGVLWSQVGYQSPVEWVFQGMRHQVFHHTNRNKGQEDCKCARSFTFFVIESFTLGLMRLWTIQQGKEFTRPFRGHDNLFKSSQIIKAYPIHQRSILFSRLPLLHPSGFLTACYHKFPRADIAVPLWAWHPVNKTWELLGSYQYSQAQDRSNCIEVEHSSRFADATYSVS